MRRQANASPMPATVQPGFSQLPAAPIGSLSRFLVRTGRRTPDRRDRVELTDIAYHWPNLCTVRGCEHAFGHHPLRLKWFYDATRVGDTEACLNQRRVRLGDALTPSETSLEQGDSL
jgi:hypothetical protein